jgi:TonB family protein
LTRDANGRIAEVIRYTQKGSPESKTVYEYFDKDNRVRSTSYDSKNAVSKMETRSYTADGQLAEEVFYNPDGSRRAVWTDEFDEKGNVIEETILNLDGYVRFRYAYQTDLNQNWVKRTALHLINNSGTLAYEPVEVTYRDITYEPGSIVTAPSNASRLELHIETGLSASWLNAKPIKVITPSYPTLASKLQITGTVKVTVCVDEDGNVKSARAVDGPPELIDAAEAAAWKSKFNPALSDGKPRTQIRHLEYNFNL